MNDKLISKYIHLAEKTLLIFIAFATIYATVQEIYELVKIKRVLGKILRKSFRNHQFNFKQRLSDKSRHQYYK